MEDTDKYLIHADVTADGVVERNDVVGAIFGQTEGLLGTDLDLRTLQQSSKVGRIDVSINSQNGQSFGRITIASGLDRVETAILAASLETIDRIGPCRSTVDVERIEDVRAAKRREVVERAKGLLGAFEESTMSSAELVEQVRESARTGEVAEYEGLPAGPRVADGDAITVVEGRADVLVLLEYGIKNAIAVEGTNVPDAVAALTTERTTTAFLDGDRGGDLILKELAQVGEVEYVAVAPAGKSVEDLSREEVHEALRGKVAHELVAEAGNPREAVAATDGSARPAPATDRIAPATAEPTVSEPGETTTTEGEPSPARPPPTDAGSVPSDTAAVESAVEPTGEPSVEPTESIGGNEVEGDESESSEEVTEGGDGTDEPATLGAHVRNIIDDETDQARLLDGDFTVIATIEAAETFDAIAEASAVPVAVVIDGELDQRVLDVAAQRGVEQIVARSTGEFVKRPTDVRVRTADQLRSSD
ncbi:DNA primase [Halococcus morrhuae DSM 1307]|uniref:DNA primase DnaG n=1 Tax=Halococcus morrhuae DSM 1307 TaxID=931277 RepID=M0M4M9_HALMO|nr:DNA primase DnaG [Halococcus morrhuae]EMA40358.1 DNA primase [Halococcus morrhuae DSM 1307]